MKKLFITVSILVLVSISGFAQKIQEGSLNAIKGCDKINLEVDYSSAIIHGRTEADFAIYEEDWYKDKPGIIELIREGIEDKNQKITITYNFKSIPTIRVIVDKITSKGDTNCHAEIIDAEGSVVCKIVNIFGEGGTFGTNLNLIKDGSSSVGECLGKFLKGKVK